MRKIFTFSICCIFIVAIAFLIYDYIELYKTNQNLDITISKQDNMLKKKEKEYNLLLKENNLLLNDKIELNQVAEEHKSDIKNINMELTNAYMKLENIESAFENDRIYVPNNYYFIGKVDRTYDELVYYLNNMFEMPVDYEINVFDCSEQAAFMERELENHGFDAEIVLGDSPNGSGVKHAWIIVYTSDSYRVAIEPTAIMGGMDGETQSLFSKFKSQGRGIVYSNQNNNYYEVFDYKVSDIYEAIDIAGYDEFDWWLGMWKLRQPSYKEFTQWNNFTIN